MIRAKCFINLLVILLLLLLIVGCSDSNDSYITSHLTAPINSVKKENITLDISDIHPKANENTIGYQFKTNITEETKVTLNEKEIDIAKLNENQRVKVLCKENININSDSSCTADRIEIIEQNDL